MTIAVLVACVAVVGTVGGSAQPDDDGQITINRTDSQDVETYAQEIDSELKLISWKYDNDRNGFILRFEANESKTITITEAVQFERGAGSGRIYRERLPEGQSRVFVSVRKRAGEAAATMVTSQSIEENRYSYVSTGTRIDRGPIDYGVVQLLIAGTAIVSAGGAFTIVKKRREEEEKEVERVL